MGWFGPTKDEVWQELCQELGADFVTGGFWKGSKVQAHVGPWTITLDTYTVSAGESAETYTRIRAPYVNRDGFRFTIHRTGFLSNVALRLGMQDIEVGDPEFDEAFVIQADDELKARDLFANPRLRALFLAQPRMRLEIKDDEGWFRARFPEGVDEVHFRAGGVIKDIERLKGLFELFVETLNQLCRIGSATKEDPGVEL
jgi:hypothetical protein